MVKIDEESYGFLLDEFTEERMDSRCNWLYDLMAGYLRSEGIQDKVLISQNILNHVIIDYYVDVYRLKGFQNIEKIHESKIYAYT